MFRSTGGLTLIVSSNKFIIQVSGEAFLFLDQEDIQDILRRAKVSIQKNRKYDIEKDLRIDDLSISVGRLDSQITIAIDKDDVEDFFHLDDIKCSGRERVFKSNKTGIVGFTGKSWIRNNEKNVYLKSSEDLKKEAQPVLKKRDFLRIYDKLTEVIETTLPHSDKRIQLINKYAKYINPEKRIFRIEIQENDRRLTTELNQLLDFNSRSFEIVCNSRLKAFAKRNPFKMWSILLPEAVKAKGQEQDAPSSPDVDVG